MESPVEPIVASGQLISTSSTQVNVHCNACQTYLGIFENEWIRLTSSYARPAHQGIHHGTNVSEKTRAVPAGTGQRAAEGCILSDVVCQKCSAIVGQYCKEAPTVEQHYLEGTYFYKLSRVTLRNSNLDPIDPIFAYGEEMTPDMPGSPVPSVIAPDPKWSHPPPIKSHFKNVYHSGGLMPPPPRSSRTPAVVRQSHTPRLSSRQQSHLARESSSVRDGSVSSQRWSYSVRAVNPAETPEGLLALRRVLQHDVAFEKMATMMENLQREVRELRQSTAPAQEKSIASKRSQAEDEELQALRAENQALKKVIKTLPPQTQFENPIHSQSYDDVFGTPESNSTNALGKRKRNSDVVVERLFYENDDVTGEHDDFDESTNEVSGLATLEQDAAQGYSVWQGEDEGSEGDNYSQENEGENEDGDPSRSTSANRVLSDTATGDRHSARSRERRQTLPADFIAEEQRYLLSDSNDENFDPNDPKVKGRKHKRTRSAERRRRERQERQQDSLWKKGVPGGGYENGDGWVEQKRHHSGRFGRKAAVGEGLAIYPKYVNDKLFANGRQIPTTHKRLARELVYLGLDDWIDKDKSDPLYRRTIRVARKHYAYHHGGISSKALCQGKYTKRDLEAVGMWDDELFEEINMGEESDVEKLDFPLDPALQISIEKWKKEGAQAKERKKTAAQEVAGRLGTEGASKANGQDADDNEITPPSQTFDVTGMTQFSDEDGGDQESNHASVPQVPDRVEKHKKFDSIWQAPVHTSENSVLSIIQHAEARIKAAEDEMGEPTFKSKRAQKFKTIGPSSGSFSAILSQVPKDTFITPANDKVKKTKRRKAPSADTIRMPATESSQEPPTTMVSIMSERKKVTPVDSETVEYKGFKKTVAEHLEILDLSDRKESNSFLKELRAFFAVNKNTGAHLTTREQINLTDDELMVYAEHFLETNVVRVGGSRKIGLEFWPDDSSRKLSYIRNKEEIKQHVYDIFAIQRLNKARSLRQQLNKSLGENLSTAQVLDPSYNLPDLPSHMSPSAAAKRASQVALLNRPFDNGLRYDVKPGFRGNKYYYEDGVPKTAEDAARLERRSKQKTRTRNSLLTNGLLPEEILEQDQARRRATMHDMSTSNMMNTDSPLMTPTTREASILGDSVLQMATAMKQLTKAFHHSVDASAADSDANDDDDVQSSGESMGADVTLDVGVVNIQGATAAKALLEPPNANAPDTSEADEARPSVIIMNSEVDDEPAPISHDTTQEGNSSAAEGAGAEVETALDAGKKQPEPKTVPKKPTIPPLLTRSATRASSSVKSSIQLAGDIRHVRQPVAVTDIPKPFSSTSDKENTMPMPEPDTAASSISGDLEPPPKKVKMMPRRGPGRQPRKSAAELDQLAKETMEHETRSSARRSSSGMYSASRNHL